MGNQTLREKQGLVTDSLSSPQDRATAPNKSSQYPECFSGIYLIQSDREYGSVYSNIMTLSNKSRFQNNNVIHTS